jgi:N-acetylmuramoyl-L-alanine amidase
VFKLRQVLTILAAIGLLAGCSSHRGVKTGYADQPMFAPKEPIETEHITDTPTLAPPPATTPEILHPPTNHSVVNAWIPLQRWSDEHHAGPVQRLTTGTVPTFALKASNGLLIIRVYDLVAFWNSMEFHLGFAPQIVNGQPVIHSLDFAKNIEPLLHPLTLPDRTNRVIVIDPGHGGSNLGTKSVFDGSYEKGFALDWAKRLAAILETNGWKVFLTRTSDVDMALTNRVTFANENKANLFLSLHFNSAPSPTDHDEAGIETFCVTPTSMPSTLKREYEDDATLVFPNNRFDAENLQYAVQVQRSLLKISGARDHGVRRARFMTVLRGQNCPAILVEGGYLSNPREAKRVADPAYRQKLAEAVASALIEKTVASTPPPPVENHVTVTNGISTQ